MKKKQLRKRLLICLAGLLFSLSVISRDTEPGYDFIVNGIYYMILSSESKTVAVSYKTEVDPDYGPNYYVSGYSGNVTIPSNVTYNSITYKVTEIGSHAFDDSSIISVSIPNTVEAIGTQAFVDCADLQSIIVPNSVKSIGNYAFYGCTSLRSVTLSNQLTVLPNFLFKDCRSLSSIIIPQSVVDIGKNAFSGCTSLTDIAISNTVTTIEDLAFEGCSKLQSITIPGSVKNIGSAIFFGCSSLISITVDNNPYIDSRDNCNAIVNTSTNVLITGCRNSTIPNSVTGIGEKAFYGCEGFQSIIIPDNIISIGAYSFANCQLQDVTIGKSVRNIGNYAFGYVYKTDQVYGTDNSFNYTEEPKFTASSLSLKNVTSKIQEPFAISAEVFSGFFTYERGEWRSEGQDMGNGEIYYGEPSYYQEQISQTVFPAASLTVPSGTIDKYAALDAWNKFSLIIESGYTDGYIFNKEVSGIKMTFQILSIEDKTLQIGNGKEPSIPTETSASISLPSEIHLNGSTYNVVSIADSAFYNCKNLTSIEIPASITKSGNNSFS